VSEELETSVEAAAVFLSLVMLDTERPVADLGTALGRISRLLADYRSESRAQGGLKQGLSAQDAERARTLIENDVAICIQSLQYHDRLIQQLAALRNLLAELAHHEPVEVAGFSARRWEEMLKMLRQRLTRDSQHKLFELLTRAGAINLTALHDDLEPVDGSVEGSVELF